MESLGQLTIVLASFTAIAMLLGLIAGAFVFSLEDVARGRINKSIYLRWLHHRVRDRTVRPLPRNWYSLPYKQFTGAIASLFQPDPVGLQRYDYEALNVRDAFAEIGALILGHVVPPHHIEGDLPDDTDYARTAMAERALDSLQAELGLIWTRTRYGANAAVIFIVFSVLWLLQRDGTNLGFFKALLTLPIIFVVAIIFGALFRDLIERLVGHRR